MTAKAIEIRDRNTFIPAIAISTAPANDSQRYLLRVRRGGGDSCQDRVTVLYVEHAHR